LVGFALETENLVPNATEKLREKNLDMVVANGPMALDSDFNEITIIDRTEKAESLLTATKEEISEIILDKIAALKKG